MSGVATATHRARGAPGPLVAIGLAALGGACAASRGPRHDAREPAPAASAAEVSPVASSASPEIPPEPAAIDAGSDAGGSSGAAAPAPSASVALPGSNVVIPATCSGRSFDLDQLIAKKSGFQRRRSRTVAEDCTWQGAREDLPDLSEAANVDVAAAVLENPLPPGEASPVRVVFTNREASPATLLFRGCDGDEAPFVVEGAYDAQGRRKDRVPTNMGCGVSRGCMPWTLVLRVDPGGSVTATVEYRALTRRLDPDCRERPHGVLAKGDYVLRIRTPLISFDAKRLQQPRVAEARLSVGP